MTGHVDTGTPPAAGSGAADLPITIELLRNARLVDGELVDVHLDGGVVANISTAGDLGTAENQNLNPDSVLDLDGRLVLTAPAEPHAHLDKALSFDLIRPPFGDLNSAVSHWRAYAATMTVESIVQRARAQALSMIANGITAVRSHVDVHSGFPTKSAEALLQVREELTGLMDIQLVALSSSFASTEEIESVLDLGVELVGGAPHMADDPDAEVERLVTLAAARGLGIDLHTDENLDGPLTMGHYARLVRELPRDRSYAASHCVRLGTLEKPRLDAIIDEVAAADLGVVSLPITNLYLQGWEHPVLTPRGLTAIRALMDRHVRVCAGADNVRDPFNPVGRSCAFETASLLVTAAHLSPAEAWHLVSDGARDVMGLPAAGPSVGRAAELLAVRATNVTEAIANAPGDRMVIHRGQLVARTELRTIVATPHRTATTGVR